MCVKTKVQKSWSLGVLDIELGVVVQCTIQWGYL